VSGVVVPNFCVAIEAEWNAVFESIATSFALRMYVMALNAYARELVA
jgi:hypothetical protein